MNVLRLSLLLTGSLVIFAGISQAALEAREGGGSRGGVARQIGSHAALGLEYFIRGYTPEPHRQPLLDGSSYYRLDHCGAQPITLSLEDSV